MAANQTGKTWAGGFEAAIHLTGEYPDDWTGRRFDKPVMMWAASDTGETTRDNPQRVLMGEPAYRERWGTGTIPKRCIVGEPNLRSGVANAIDSVAVRHKSGGVSIVGFKTYDQGRQKWQGPPKDIVWFDEEPPMDIYTEGLTRTNATNGMIYLTFTPLLGMSEVVRMFLSSEGFKPVIRMTIEDALHYSKEQVQAIIASYPPHERDVRAFGIPKLGSGAIFPVERAKITCSAFAIPDHWPQIVGMDFGYDHPTTAVKMAWDRDDDCIYVTQAFTMRKDPNIMLMAAQAIRAWGTWLPVAWPHDGFRYDNKSGKPLADAYRDMGLNMLADNAKFEDGSTGVEAGLHRMLQKMQTGKFKVFANLEDWFNEYETYHRKDGKVVKEHDDLLDATRYAYMSLRFATVKPNRIDIKDSLYNLVGGNSWQGF